MAVWREEASGKQAEAADAAELGPVCELAIRQRSNVVRPAGDGAHVAQPIQTGADGTVEAVLALGFGRHPGVRLAEVFRAGLWASGWLEAAWLRGREGGASRRAERAGGVLAILAAVTEQADFDAALMACCNEAADRFQADRVAIGLVRRSARCRLAAMSQL